MKHFSLRSLVLLVVLQLGVMSVATAQNNGTPSLPADEDSFRGDTLHFRTVVRGIKRTDGKPADAPQCAPRGSVVRVDQETTDAIAFYFKEVAKGQEDECALDSRVKENVQYAISRADLAKYSFSRSGLAFGGLVVPFKYRLGNDKELISSPAIAPFVGYRLNILQGLGITFTPVLASGLSLVPVPDAAGTSTTTKSAYTVALGFRITSSKNGNFSAGLLYGRDFLNKADVAADPKLHKPWLSFYLGASV